MADGITVPLTGSGDATAKVATDDAGTPGHVQIIKLAISTDGSATLLPADAANGLDVDVTRLPALAAGTNNIGDVDLLTDASLYTEGDTDSTITGRPVLWEDASNTLVTVNTAKPLPASIVPLADGTDSITAMQGVRTSGGATIQAGLSAASTNATNVKASAGQVYGWYLYNQAAYAVFLKFYNSASAPTAGSGTPVMRIGVPTAAGANVWLAAGIAFSTGIGYTITKLIADNDTTAVAASDLAFNIFYK